MVVGFAAPEVWEGLAGVALLAGVDAPMLVFAPVAGVVAAGVAFAVADEPSADAGFGCFGAAGFAVGAAPLVLLFSRDVEVGPPTVARPTLAFPTAADARAGPLVF